MTANQIAWLKANEEARANRAREEETNRSNLAKEAENFRSNFQNEAISRTKIVADSANKLAGGLGLVSGLRSEITAGATSDASGKPDLSKSAQSANFLAGLIRPKSKKKETTEKVEKKVPTLEELKGRKFTFGQRR